MEKRMTSLLLTIACLLAACKPAATTSSSTDEQQAPPPKKETIAFNADSAYQFVKAQCDFGPRVPGTPAHERCGRWLENRLGTYCDTVVVQRGTVTTFDGVTLHISNIIGSFNPQAATRVLLLAHWDCRPWADNDPDSTLRRQPVMGANDGASGVGVLLEVARCLAQKRPAQGVDILLVDAEDWGENGGDEDSWALGTQYWAQNPHVQGYSASHGILLDMVGARDAQFTMEIFSLQYARSTLLSVWDTAQKAGFSSYFRYEPGGGVTDDHLAINRMGIPCINIIDMRTGDTGFFDGWHTTHDTLDVIDPRTLKAVGQTLVNHLLH